MIAKQPEDRQHPLNCIEWEVLVDPGFDIPSNRGLVYEIYKKNDNRDDQVIIPTQRVLTVGFIPIRLGPDILSRFLITAIPDPNDVDFAFIDEGFTAEIYLSYGIVDFTTCEIVGIDSGESELVRIMNSVNGTDMYTFDMDSMDVAVNYPLTLRPRNYKIHRNQPDWIWSRNNIIAYRFYDCDGVLISGYSLDTDADVGTEVSVFPAGTANLTVPPGTSYYEIDLAPNLVINDVYRVYIYDCGYDTNDLYQLMILEPQGGYCTIPVRLVSNTAQSETETFFSDGCLRTTNVSNGGEKVWRNQSRATWNFEIAIDDVNPEYGRWMQQISATSRSFLIKGDGPFKIQEFIIDQGITGYSRSGGLSVISGYLTDVFRSKSWR